MYFYQLQIIALWHVKDEQPEQRLFTIYSSQNQVAPLQTGMSRKPDLTLLREKETEIVELKQQLQQVSKKPTNNKIRGTFCNTKTQCPQIYIKLTLFDDDSRRRTLKY